MGSGCAKRQNSDIPDQARQDHHSLSDGPGAAGSQPLVNDANGPDTRLQRRGRRGARLPALRLQPSREIFLLSQRRSRRPAATIQPRQGRRVRRSAAIKIPMRRHAEARVLRPAPLRAAKLITFIKSGAGIEGEPDAERLLARSAFRSFQLLGYSARRCLLARHRFQFADLACSPCAPLFCSLSHNTSLSTKVACIPYGSERKVSRWDRDHDD